MSLATSHGVSTCSRSDGRMPETARLLEFPSRRERREMTAEEAVSKAKEYLDVASSSECAESLSFEVRYPEPILAILAILKDLIETDPAKVRDAAVDIHARIQRSDHPLGLFDERDYLLGELARFAGLANRVMGEYDKAERWLDRAEASYRNTINPGPLLATVAYARLAIRYETHRYEEILELTSSLVATFGRFRMTTESLKTRFVEALALRASGRGPEAFNVLCSLATDLDQSKERSLFGQVLVHMGDYSASLGNHQGALGYYQRAVPVLATHGRPTAIAELKWSIGSTYRAQGQLTLALEALRAAREHYHRLGNGVFSAFVGLALADTLLSLGRPREAEWEILAAIPAIQNAELGAEIAAAAALLQESARQRKADPERLQELRDRLAQRG